MRLVAAALASIFLVACSGQNTSLNRLQFSGASEPFPEHYQVEAARFVQARGAEISTIQVSAPAETLGASAFGPKRWYSCIRGLPAPPPAKTMPTVEQFVSGWLGEQPLHYDVIMIFSAGKPRPSVHDGLDSPLCQGVTFSPLTATPPLI